MATPVYASLTPKNVKGITEKFTGNTTSAGWDLKRGVHEGARLRVNQTLLIVPGCGGEEG